jgi:hypothetical protein
MLRRAITTGCCLVAAGTALSACAPSSAPGSTASVAPTSSATRTPAATAVPVPAGPYAVVVTNDQRTGNSYEVMLIDDAARLVAHATAQLPALQPNETLSLPLVSASNTSVYYLDGNSDINSLSPTGVTTTVTSIPNGSSSEVTFAVSPDGQRIAVAEIKEQANVSGDTSRGYVEDLPTGADQVSLWTNDGTDALRWPVGWHRASLIDYLSPLAYQQQQCGVPNCEGGMSYHVVDPTTGDATATVCETPANQAGGAPPNTTVTADSPDGLPTPAGTVCDVFSSGRDQNGTSTGITDNLEAIGWDGTATAFTQFPGGGQGNNELYDCFLSPDGSRMACTANSNNSLALVSSGGTITNTGHQYDSILGWIDATHLLVNVDSGDLGVLDPSTGSLTTLPVTQAGDVQMVATLPGAL